MYQEHTNTIVKNKLLNHIEHKEIAFQFGDGLLCFTRPDGNYGDDDIAKSIADEVEEMRKFIIESRSITTIYKDNIVGKNNEFGFNELAGWVTDKDLLILVDKDLLLCLPDSYKSNVIIDVA